MGLRQVLHDQANYFLHHSEVLQANFSNCCVAMDHAFAHRTLTPMQDWYGIFVSVRADSATCQTHSVQYQINEGIWYMKMLLNIFLLQVEKLNKLQVLLLTLCVNLQVDIIPVKSVKRAATSYNIFHLCLKICSVNWSTLRFCVYFPLLHCVATRTQLWHSCCGLLGLYRAKSVKTWLKGVPKFSQLNKYFPL